MDVAEDWEAAPSGGGLIQEEPGETEADEIFEDNDEDWDQKVL